MKLSLSWLREWIDVDATPERIADALTRHGFYVEGVETHGHAYPGVVVARVLEAGKHPNADRLSLCRVDGGAGEVAVVCGAPNVRSGMIVALATVGARLPNGMQIERAKIRGQESFGMLCSARELGLSEEHAGILDLEPMVGASPRLGQPFEEVLGPPETLLEVEMPFNRGDGFGVVGLAREVKAALGGSWTEAARERLDARWSGDGAFDLRIEDAEGCPRYIAQVIENVKVGPSPRWLSSRLESVGQRSINTVVDVTNWVLFELGQPVHAFDLDRLAGGAIRVRRARAGERLTTLDGKERSLDPEVLVIADAKVPTALAGIMGGQASEVTESSTRLLLECATFDPRRVRRGSRALDLSTEASKRYERGVDPEIASPAAVRFFELLERVSPGVTRGPGCERRAGAAAPKRLAFRPSRGERLIGLPVTAEEAARRLRGFEFEVADGSPLQVTVPSWRVDVALEDDLVEEVARAIGYDAIPEVPLETSGAYATRSTRERRVTRARQAMLSRGLSEAWCSSLITEREALPSARLLGEESPRLVRLQNPMSREGEVLRPNLIAGLLRACAHNLRQGQSAVRLFEVGHGFAASDSASGLPEERLMLSAIVCGPRWAHAHDASAAAMDFDDAKGLWEAWLAEMSVDTAEWRAYSAAGWKPGASAEVAVAASRIGWAGTLGQSLLREWDIETPVHLFTVRLDALDAAAATRRVSLPDRYPPARRDVAFFVPSAVTHGELERLLSRAAGEWLSSIELFDVYTGAGTPAGMKSMAYALEFQHPERTLAESEIQDVQERMVGAVAQACGGRLREK